MDPVQKRSISWSVAGLILLIAVGLIAIWTLRQVDDSDYWLEHTREVIQGNRQLLSDLKDAESAERGFIITGDEKYLEGYRAYSADIPPALAKLEKLVADSPTQLARAKDKGKNQPSNGDHEPCYR